jgi:diguanylate cyclase (GGDEF)-like protein
VALGSLLALLHGGGRSLRTVRLTSTARSDTEALCGARERARERRGAHLLTISSGGPARELPRFVEETTRLWLERPDKVREEKSGEFPRSGVRVGDSWWLYNEHQGAVTNNGSGGSPGLGREFDVILKPAPLLPWFDFEILGDEVQADRSAVRVLGRPRPLSEPVFFLPSPVPAGCDRYEFVVDLERGTLLRLQGFFDGMPALDLQIVEIVFDEPIAPETFVFEPPAGEAIKDLWERDGVDTLTGLTNRPAAEAWLDRLCQRADLQDEALSVALIDIDDMGVINDSYGHAVGDLVLRRVADVLRDATGARDIAARFGGEEFLIAWLGDDAQEAADQADTVRVRFHELEVELDDGGRAGGFALSAGVSQLSTLSPSDRHGEPGYRRLLDNADAALHAAKEAGGDCIRIF